MAWGYGCPQIPCQRKPKVAKPREILKLSLISINKKREPFAQNPIYQKQFKVGCPFCKNTGRKKNFKTLWCLYMHFKTHHSFEPNFKNTVTILADFIIQGVLL